MPSSNLFLGSPTMRAKSSFTRAAAACCAQANAAGTTAGADGAGGAPLAWLLRKVGQNIHDICWEKLPHLHNSSCDIHRGPWGTSDTSISNVPNDIPSSQRLSRVGCGTCRALLCSIHSKLHLNSDANKKKRGLTG